jgi:integrase/recombinase XerD
MLSFANWPTEDQARWETTCKNGDRFDESGRGAHLAPTTLQARQESYGRFLAFISATHQELLTLPPEARIDRNLVAEYVVWRRRLCADIAIANDLEPLRGALRLICPDTDWSWLLTITKRIAAMAPRSTGKYHLVTSDRLYLLGAELMDRAVAEADVARRIRKAQAFQYRDGLVIALLALIPMRRGTLTALCIGRQLVETSDLWALDIPAADTKSRRALDYPISREMSARIDVYLHHFRSCIPAADKHIGLWPSNKGCPMSPDAIYNAVRNRTKKAFGFGVNLHRFRHAAASFWSTHDPVNVRGAKDLLGHASFGTTEKHYLMAQSRLAGRALAQAVDMVRK